MILYEGPSLINGEPVVAIAVEDSNPKTGRMLMVHILLQDRPPSRAAFDGGDEAICGGCPFRALVGEFQEDDEELSETKATRTCYVRLTDDGSDGHPPADEKYPPDVLWRMWKDGQFEVPRDGFAMTGSGTGTLCGTWAYQGDFPVRLGAYGDPAAVPTRVWAELLRYVKQWTGYTHQWKPKRCMLCSGIGYDEYGMTGRCNLCKGLGKEPGCDPDLKRYCMASVDSPEERAEAQALGWRTFMVVPEVQSGWAPDMFTRPAWTDDILCPATDPHPRRNATCSTCLLCRGLGGENEPMKNVRSIWEVVHGVNRDNHTWE